MTRPEEDARRPFWSARVRISAISLLFFLPARSPGSATGCRATASDEQPIL